MVVTRAGPPSGKDAAAARLAARSATSALDRELHRRLAASPGWSLRSSVSPRAVIWRMTLPEAGLQPALEALAQQVTTTASIGATFEVARRLETEAARERMLLDSDATARFVAYRAFAARDGRSGTDVALDATPNALGRVSLAGCIAWHRANVVPSRATLIVVGAVEGAPLRARAATAFRAWLGSARQRRSVEGAPPASATRRDPKPAPPPSAPAGAERLPPIELVHRAGTTTAEVVVVARGPSDEATATEAATALYCRATDARREAVTEDGRCRCRRAYGDDGQAWLVHRQRVSSAAAPRVLRATWRHLDRLPTTVTDAAVHAAAHAAIERLPLRWDGSRELAHTLVEAAVLERPLDGGRAERAEWRALAPAAVREAAATLGAPTQRITVVFGDATKLAAPLARLAPVRVLESSELTVARVLPREAAQGPSQD